MPIVSHYKKFFPNTATFLFQEKQQISEKSVFLWGEIQVFKKNTKRVNS